MIVKWVVFTIAAVFMLAVLLAEANCGPHWMEYTEEAVGGWVIRLLGL